ncbi:MAG: ribokinase [Anaerolineaceae bacterium]|nr:ribokinase [Anaerolineaceae bacterium]
MREKVLVIGSINLDIIGNVERYPRLGETVLAAGTILAAGGKGANQALSLQKMGADVIMAGRTGGDIFAELALAELRSHGVDLAEVKESPGQPTGLAMIWVDKNGDNAIVVSPGANAELSAADIHEMESLFSSAVALVMQLEIPIETVFQAAKTAKKHAVPVILNTAPAAKLSDEMFTAIDVLICNESEAALLSGAEIHTLEDAKAAARSLLGKIGAGKVIITLGELGTIYTENGGAVNYQPAFEVEAVDSVGAGDAFVGGLVACLIREMPLREAVTWGNACGALAATRRGAQVSLPDMQEVEFFIRSRQQDGAAQTSR